MNLRRRWLWALACLGWVSTTRVAAQHVPERELLQPYVGTARIQRDRVKLELPRLADNGFTVPLKVSVSSTARSSLAVRRLLLLSNRNPRPLIAAFEFDETAPPPVISTTAIARRYPGNSSPKIEHACRSRNAANGSATKVATPMNNRI